jgi:hypothetical protein
MNVLGIDTIVIGDTLDFTTAVAGYPASDGWTLKYRLIPRLSGTPITLAAATASDGASYRVQVAPAVTAAYGAGDYTWYAWVEKTGARVTVDDGLVSIKGDPSALTASDGRSHARKVYDAINAVIENRATKDQQEYAIGGRSLKRTPVADLLVLRDRYRAEVSNEDAAEKIADGLGNPRTFGVRFHRV